MRLRVPVASACLGLRVSLVGTSATRAMAQASVTSSNYFVDTVGRAQIEVTSNPDSYYVLFLMDEFQVERPIDMALSGQTGETIQLSDRMNAYPQEHYRVAQYSLSNPEDLDDDGIDDVQEWSSLGRFNPFNSAREVARLDGVVAIPDRDTYEQMSYKGSETIIDDHLEGLEFVKFFLLDMDTESPRVYFMNTVTHRAHRDFAQAIQMECHNTAWSTCEGQMKGELVYHPNILAPDGSLGVYRFAFQPTDTYSFREIQRAYEVLAQNCHAFQNNLFFFPAEAALSQYLIEKVFYEESRVSVLLEEDIWAGVGYLPLNVQEGYGRLILMDLNERPHPRDIVIYEALPNELSRVGGIITSVPQTPLSHVNLRAIQDGVPNSYVANVLQQQLPDGRVLEDLLGKLVYYRVEQDSYVIRESNLAEVNAHYESQRPEHAQVPERDLSMTEIKALDDIRFHEWTRFGVKATNVATLRSFGFPDGTIPNGFAVPFYFYDEFMKTNGFYEDVRAFLKDDVFLNDYDVQAESLKDLRERIEVASMPQWMLDALESMHLAFPHGQSVRTRSSTNNEDLPGFSGAGLYDSFTHKPDEGHMSKSIKQVYASLWNFRAFSERQFLRIDHFSTAMGVLIHPNFKGELVNGVGVSTDPIYGSDDSYYLNTQIGEDLVTNPEALSVPEEILVDASFGSGGDPENSYIVVRPSNLVDSGEKILSDEHLSSLVGYLGTIHRRFRRLYRVKSGAPFAMEIEYKVTKDGQLAIKQARPWVFESFH